jgi:hypothetical protein
MDHLRVSELIEKQVSSSCASGTESLLKTNRAILVVIKMNGFRAHARFFAACSD